MAQNVHKLKTDEQKPTGLALLREPFEPHQISKLPKPTKRQTDEVKADFKKGIRCKQCGQWHHPDVVHLDYVGHAALTDRLLECDPEWNWEPAGVDERGAPLLDKNGGMWIRLTVCGVTRLGYGHPDGKQGGDAIKETIGDALRNAAMRFGAALDLWHKGVLHAEETSESDETEADIPEGVSRETHTQAVYAQAEHDIQKADSKNALKAVWEGINWTAIPDDLKPGLVKAKDARLAELSKPKATVEPDFDNLESDPFPGDLPTESREAMDNMRAG